MIRRYLILAVVCLPLTACQQTPPAPTRATYDFVDGDWVPTAQPRVGTPEGELAIIRQHIQQDRHAQAVSAARRFVARYAQHPGREVAMNYAGQAEMERGRYWQAFQWYRQQLDAYPAGLLASRALERYYEIGRAFLGGQRRLLAGVLPVSARREGERILQRIAEIAPGSAVAERSLLLLGRHFMERGNHAAAVDVYDQFLLLYSRTSPAAPHAMLQAARATYAQYGGPDYDETPLLDAEQRYTEVLRAWPDRAAEEGVPAILEQIESSRAHAQYRTAMLYERLDRQPAAIYYYRLTQQRYPQTPWAEASAEQLRRLGVPDAPDEPVADDAGEAP